jgi:hypothetical protein
MKTMFLIHICVLTICVFTLLKVETAGGGKTSKKIFESCDIFRFHTCIYVRIRLYLSSICEANSRMGNLFN